MFIFAHHPLVKVLFFPFLSRNAIPEAQQKLVRCGICLGACMEPVSGMLANGRPCCNKQWICNGCLNAALEHEDVGAGLCPLCRAPIVRGHVAFSKDDVDKTVEMLTLDSIAPGCDRHGFDARSLVKHLRLIHEPDEVAKYDTALKLLHYDYLRGMAISWRINTRSLRATVHESKKVAEDQLVRHCAQLASKEAQLYDQRERYEGLLKKKQTYERDAYVMLGRMCFEAAGEEIQHYAEADKSCGSGGHRSRSRTPTSRNEK